MSEIDLDDLYANAGNKTLPEIIDTLRAEVISLRTRLAAAEAKVKERDIQLSAWHEGFGSQQLTHALARLEAAERKVDDHERIIQGVEAKAAECEGLREAVKEAGEILTRPFVDGRYDPFASIGKSERGNHLLNEGGVFRQEARRWVAKHWAEAAHRAREQRTESGESDAGKEESGEAAT